MRSIANFEVILIQVAMRIIILVFLLISIDSFSRNEVVISKEDFISQFSDTTITERTTLICTRKTGEKIIIGFRQEATLLLVLNNKKKKFLLVTSIKYEDGLIDAISVSSLTGNQKYDQIAIDDVAKFSLRKMFIWYETPYFDLDSVKNACREKNDSLLLACEDADSLAIYLNPKGNGDSLTISQDVCYHISFNGAPCIEYGVIHKITLDSIFVSKIFEPGPLVSAYEKSQIEKYAIADISGLNLLKGGGYSFRSITMDDFDIEVRKAEEDIAHCPFWYRYDSRTGVIFFYRLWLTDNGYKGVMKEDGKIYWYEG